MRALLALAAWLSSDSPAVAADFSKAFSLSRWDQGPVRYLITRSESKLFHGLKTDQARIEFIKRFWERRDPVPGTAQNELRAIFWQRVEEANRLFGDTPRPGWATDRGKIYILLGPPLDQERNDEFDTKIRSVPTRGLMRWHFRSNPHLPSAADFIVAFYHDIDTDWKLTDDPRLNNLAVDVSNSNFLSIASGLSDQVADQIFSNGSPLSVAMDLAQVQQVPTEKELLQAVVKSEQFIDSFGCIASAYLTGQVDPSGRSEVAFNVAIERSALVPAWDGTALSLDGRFAVSVQARTPSGAAINVDETAFNGEPHPLENDRWLRFQGRGFLPAGAYELRAVVLDRRGSGAATSQLQFAVPDSGAEAPRIDGPVLARQLIPQPDIRESQSNFRMAGALVIPFVVDAIPATTQFQIVLNLTGPSATALDWSVTRTIGNATEMVGKPHHLDDGRGLRAWQFGAGELPPGSYKILIEAKNGSGTVRRQLEFTLQQ